MISAATDQVRETVNDLYLSASRGVLATLIRLLGDFDVAEEALHDAFKAALEQWPRDGVPSNPRAWLVSAGRFKAIDGIRKNARLAYVVQESAFPAGVTVAQVIEAKMPGDEIEYERQMLAAHGFLPVTLGPRTLRSDTACIALLALVHASIGTSSSR